MEILLYIICGILVLILGITTLRKRVKANTDTYLKKLKSSQQNNEYSIDDFMCLMLDDGSTIISGKTSNGEKFSARGNARRSVK